MVTNWNESLSLFDKKPEPPKSPEDKEANATANKIEGVLNDFVNGTITQDEAIKALVNDRINFGYERIKNFCTIAQNLRNTQKEYFSTRSKDVLKEAQRLEIDFDKRLETFQKILETNK